MKIEKINENQIKCTLTREDLVSRKIRLSELTYGSEKAKTLFRDMMAQASRDLGFEIDNTPLMIEAIPISVDSIVLIITKVDDPEELDSRFSRFSSEDNAPAAASSSMAETLSGLDDILDLITRLTHSRKNAANGAIEDHSPQGGQTTESTRSEQAEPENAGQDKIYNITRFFLFRDLEPIISASAAIGSLFKGHSVLFKNPEDKNYYLILRKENTGAEDFNRVCNVLTEYGLSVDYTNGLEEFFREHMETIVGEKALETLASL